MSERITRQWSGHSEMTCIVPVCTCGWKGEPVYAWQDYQLALINDQEATHYASHRKDQP